MQKNQIQKIILMLIFIGLIILSLNLLYPGINELVKKIRSRSYIHSYNSLKEIVPIDVSNLPEAKAVPILIYHGIVTDNILGENTKRSTFISQMEMLKKEGYQTISVKEYDLWREDNFILPPKPIIITFDDGRKDSYFTVDEILKKLGFKATIFIATQATQNNQFFLNWNDLKTMQSTDRWEIEAHGRDSHIKIPIDAIGTQGNFLASRMYNNITGIENIDEYEKRIDIEYKNGKMDLLTNLNINAKYFAIPLNSYGVHSGLSNNHDEAYEYNYAMTQKYYKLAFVQAESTDESVLESFYNYKNSYPYKIKRLQVKNMSADNLLFALNSFAEKPIELTYPTPENKNFISENLHFLYGTIKEDNGIILSSNKTNNSTRIILGSPGWKDYVINTEITKNKGRSVSVIAYYIDEDNFISLDWSEKSLKLIERRNGIEREIDQYYPFIEKETINVVLKIKDSNVLINIGDVTLKGQINKNISRGSIGFSVWDPVLSQSTIKKIVVNKLN